MNIGADLIKGAKARKIAEAADDLNTACAGLVDALADYEDADNTDDRQDARETVADCIREVLTEADGFRAVADTLEADA